MKKSGKTALAVVVSLLAIIIALIILNMDLIMVVKDGLFESKENLIIKKEETIKNEKEALENAGVSDIRPLTEEEAKELSSGNITEEEAVKIVTGQTTIEQIKEGKDTPEESEKEPVNSSNDDVNVKIAELVGKIYVVEAKFTNELSALEKWAIDEYESVPKSEKPNKKKELMSIGWPKLSALEKECDTEVKNILTELEKVLKANNQSTDLVKQINKAYNDKKQITKSHYISEYM